MRALTLAELAMESGAPLDLLQWLVDLGQLRPLDDGRFDARDAAIVGTVEALLESGIAREDLAWAIEGTGAGLTSVGRMFADPGLRSGRTYGDVVASLGEAGPRLAAVYAALGMSEPAADTHLRANEEAALTGFVDIWHRVDPEGEADVRVARIAGEASRRTNEAWLDTWDETARPVLRSQGSPVRAGEPLPSDVADPAQNLGLRSAEVGRAMVAWLHERALERTLNERIIAAFEHALVAGGRLEQRPQRPPAIAFVDIAGYTSMTVEHGDEAAAIAADGLRALAETRVREVGGRVVKLLGDGVLLRFDDSAGALQAVLALIDGMADADLPPAHAGIAAGRLVVRDGDVFGQTVNLASRIADRAKAGEVLVEEGVVIALPRGTANFEPVGRVELKGFPLPIALWRASAPDPARLVR